MWIGPVHAAEHTLVARVDTLVAWLLHAGRRGTRVALAVRVSRFGRRIALSRSCNTSQLPRARQTSPALGATYVLSSY